MKYSLFGILLATVWLTAGCAVPPHTTAPVAVARNAVPAIRDIDTTPQSVDHSTDTGGTINLQWALKEAVRHHPTVAAARDEVQASQGVVRQSGLFPNPRVFAEMEEFGGSQEFSGTEAMSGRIGISQEFLLGGKITGRLAEAEAGRHIAALQYEKTIQEIRARVESRFYKVFTLQELLGLREKQLKIIEKTHDVVAKRVQAGDTSPLDFTRSQVEKASAYIELEKTRRELEAARFLLAESWGAKFPAFSRVTGRFRRDSGLSEQELRQRLHRSPAWLLHQARAGKADRTLDLARAESFPDLELEGGVQHFNENDDQAFFLGIRLPLPLFDRNQGGIAGARASARKASHEKEAGFLTLHTTLQEAWRRLVANREAVMALERQVLPAAKSAYEAISKSYKAGETDILALHDAQRTWVRTRENRLQLLHELEKSRIAIQNLTGFRETAAIQSLSERDLDESAAWTRQGNRSNDQSGNSDPTDTSSCHTCS